MSSGLGGIYGDYGVSGSMYDSKALSGANKNTAPSDDDPLSLKKAIKAYQDERLTGLTDDEKEEIERRCKEYLDKNPIKTEQDREIFNNYVKSLLKEFGFKGDIDEYAVAMAGEMQSGHQESKVQPPEASANEHFQRSALGAASIRSKLFS